MYLNDVSLVVTEHEDDDIDDIDDYDTPKTNSSTNSSHPSKIGGLKGRDLGMLFFLLF